MKHRWVALLILVTAATSAWGAQQAGSGPLERPRALVQRDNDPVRVGMVAPDFALVRFEDVDASDPGKAKRAERVKLSSFRGQQPVLLLLSSYT